MQNYPQTIGNFELDFIGRGEYAVTKAEDAAKTVKPAFFFTSKARALRFIQKQAA